MVRLVKESVLVPSKVIEGAVAFFGPEGWAGLELMFRGGCSARFEGGGGHVSVEATWQPQSKGSEVLVESLEWDHMTHVFLEML